MKDKTKALLTGEIQVTPFDQSYNEIDRMMFCLKIYTMPVYILKDNSRDILEAR